MARISASVLLPPNALAEHEPGADGASAAAEIPRELAEFLMDLAVAMHKHAIYPRGHPLLEQAVEAVHRAIGRLLLDRPALSIGVARRQLIIEGIATDSNHPLLAELASKLHRHHLGALKFLPGVSRAELSDMLGVVGLEAQRDAQPIGLQPELLQRWTDVKLFPLSYDRLGLLEEEGAPPTDERVAGAAARGPASPLWLALARAAIASELGMQPGNEVLDPEALASAIDEHAGEDAYDDAVLECLLRIAREGTREGSNEGAALQGRISSLVSSLQPRTLERLLEMGGDAARRHRFLLDMSQGMTVHAVLDLVRAAASTEGQTISHSLVRMLTKLASHAAATSSVRSRLADGAFREHVERLVSSWSLTDPNPTSYSAALSRISHSRAALSKDGLTQRHECEPARIVGMALEIGVSGERVRHAVATMLDGGQVAELLDLLHAAPDPTARVVVELWTTIADRNPLRTLLAAPRLDHTVIRRLVARIGADAVEPILEALEHRPEGSRQDRLLSYLVQIGQPAAPAIAARLERAQSGLARELLVCLGKLAPAAPPPEVLLCREHADPAVRREAVKLLLGYAATRESALLASLADPDERVAYVGLIAAAQGCSADVAAAIRQRIDRDELVDGTVRAAGIRAVASRLDEATLDWILSRTLVTGGLLRRTRLAPTSPELLASLGALVSNWPNDPRAATAIALARQSSSASLRAAVHAR